MMRKAVEGGWLIIDHADRLKFQSRLVVTGAIVIGQDDDLFSTSLPVTILRFLGFLANHDGASRLLLNESEGSDYWSGFIDGSSMMRMESERKDPTFL